MKLTNRTLAVLSSRVQPHGLLLSVALGGWVVAIGQPNSYLLHLLVLVAIQSIVLSGLVLLMGYAGQISVGHSAYYAVGAYAAVILATRFGVGFVPAVLFGTLFSGATAFLIGLPALRLRGYFLSLSTLAFAELTFVLLREVKWLTGGTSGIYGIAPPSIGELEVGNPAVYFSLAWFLFMLIVFFSGNLARSRHGRALLAFHSDETTAETLGVDTFRYKIIIFTLSGLVAGLGGGLYAFYIRLITPGMASLDASILMLLMAFFGGVGSIWGALIGALVLILTSDMLAGLHDWNTVIYGLLLVVLIMRYPRGVAGAIEGQLIPSLRSRWAGRGRSHVSARTKPAEKEFIR